MSSNQKKISNRQQVNFILSEVLSIVLAIRENIHVTPFKEKKKFLIVEGGRISTLDVSIRNTKNCQLTYEL